MSIFAKNVWTKIGEIIEEKGSKLGKYSKSVSPKLWIVTKILEFSPKFTI